MKEFIFLYGPPAVGKSAVGRILAIELNLPFVDLDDIIQSKAEIPIEEIFTCEGESGFRNREEQAIASVLEGEPKLVALGGGALLNPNVRRIVERNGDVLCLLASTDSLLSRLEKDAKIRPLIGNQPREKLFSLLEERNEHYASFELQLDTDQGSQAQVAWQAQIKLGRFLVKGMGNDYEVRIFPAAFDLLGEVVQQKGLSGPIAIVCDQTLESLYGSQIVSNLEQAGYETKLVAIPPGENYKNLQTLEILLGELFEANVERRSTVVAFGGGVVSDLTGFAAAIYMRGIPWVAVPTSLIAMIDASIGGKTGIDNQKGKNLLGAFHAPHLVIADPELLRTLPEVEMRNGMAEVVKHGIIGDPDLFRRCENGMEAIGGNYIDLVRQAMPIKIKIISEDPYEDGVRSILNYGHTIGHAIETLSGFQLHHGEAVSIGMVAEAKIARHMQIAEDGLDQTIAEALSNLDLPIKIPDTINRSDLMLTLQADKKKSSGVIRFALPMRIGKVVHGIEVEDLESLITEI